MLKDYAKGVIGVDDHKFNKAYDFLVKYGYRFSTYSRARGYRERMKYSIVAENQLTIICFDEVYILLPMAAKQVLIQYLRGDISETLLYL